MRIGLISDTHVPEAGTDLPPQVFEALAGVDLVLHAGDLHVRDVLDWLEGIAPVYAARGNGDEGHGGRSPVPEDDRLKDAHVLHLEGLWVGLTHVFPPPEEVPWVGFQRMMEQRFGRPVDVIVCGDTHVTEVREINGVLLVNPGSPTLPHNLLPQLGHVGILTLHDGNAHARIIDLAQMRPVPPGLRPGAAP